MLQYLLFTRNPGFLPYRVLVAACICLIATCSVASVNAANMLDAVTTKSAGNAHVISIKTSSEPAYTVYELFSPPRIVVDIADISLTDKTFSLPASLPFSMDVSKISAEEPGLARLEFTFSNDYAGYEVQTVSNEIILTVGMDTAAAGQQAASAKTDSSSDQVGSLITGRQNIDSQLPKVTITGEAAGQDAASRSAGESLKRSFSFGGYQKQRITVDFYKIDLHNVFRLFREISDVNIVVDEAVSGSLTLALNDVPWDFALDIILNLKNLQKEERFNTIVILPKNKEFSWPKRSEDNLSFEANEEVAGRQAIVIQQQMNISPEVTEAKKIVQLGREHEKNGNYQDAITAYQKAFAKWPDNDKLANKISSLYLVYLNNSAKAVHYAKEALSVNSQNATAALNAAIALANMQEYAEAQQYFGQSVSVSKPSQEALLSYAIFSENREQFEGALKLLDKYTEIYGASLDSMVAAARILDKQGRHDAAAEMYKKVLLSGYRIPPDLENYIKSRIALNQSM
jgi:type IV pilus assembly protein PilQ